MHRKQIAYFVLRLLCSCNIKIPYTGKYIVLFLEVSLEPYIQEHIGP